MANFEDLKEIRQEETEEAELVKNTKKNSKVTIFFVILFLICCLFSFLIMVLKNTINFNFQPIWESISGGLALICCVYFIIIGFKEGTEKQKENKVEETPDNVQENIKEDAKPQNKTLGKIGIVIWEIVYYGALFCGGVLWVYNGATEPTTPFWLVCLIYLVLVFTNKSSKGRYENWERQAEHNEFYKRFVNESKIPLLLPQLAFLFVFTKYFDTIWLIVYYLFLGFIDTWDRRFYTNDIKQDLILEKLEKILPKH